MASSHRTVGRRPSNIDSLLSLDYGIHRIPLERRYGDEDFLDRLEGSYDIKLSPHVYTSLSLSMFSTARYKFLKALIEGGYITILNSFVPFESYREPIEHRKKFIPGKDLGLFLAGPIPVGEDHSYAMFLHVPTISEISSYERTNIDMEILFARRFDELGVFPEFFELSWIDPPKFSHLSHLPEFHSTPFRQSPGRLTFCYSLIQHTLRHRHDPMPVLRRNPRPVLRGGPQWWSNHITVHQTVDQRSDSVIWVIAEQGGDVEFGVPRLFEMAMESTRKLDGLTLNVFAANIAFFNLLLQDWRWFPTWIESRLLDRTGLVSERQPDLQERLESYCQLLLDIEWSSAALKANQRVIRNTEDFFCKILLAPTSPNDVKVTTTRPDDVKLLREELRQVSDEIEKVCVKLEVYETRTRQLIENVSTRLRSLQNEAILQRTGNQLKLGLLSQNLMSSTVIAIFLVLPGIFASTLFSTDIVRINGNGDAIFSSVALQRWLEVTLPLTLLSLIFLYVVFNLPTAQVFQRFHLWFRAHILRRTVVTYHVRAS